NLSNSISTDASEAQTKRRLVGKRQMSGLYRLKRTVSELGGRTVDKRYRVGKALAKWQAELVSDLGNDLSTQQKVIVDLIVRSKLLLDSIDAWLLSQKTLVNSRKRQLIAVVKDRQTIADGLTRNLQLLGLQRRQKPAKTLADFEAELEAQRASQPEEEQQPVIEANSNGDQQDT